MVMGIGVLHLGQGFMDFPGGPPGLPGGLAPALPGGPPDTRGGYTIEVNQCDWRHRARKATWLYIVGVPQDQLPTMPPPREPTHVIAPAKTQAARAAARGRHIPKSQRHITPPLFAAWLVAVARQAGGQKMSGNQADDPQ